MSICVESSRADLVLINLWVRSKLKGIQTGGGRIGELGSSTVSEV